MKNLAVGLFMFTALAMAPVADAAVITVTLPEFSGTPHGSGDAYPLPPVLVGTFTYSIPVGEEIVAASIEGQFGNSASSSTAGVDVELDGLLVAQCVPFSSPCWTGPGPTSWAFVFTPAQFGLLADGSADLEAIQTNEFTIRLGATTLLIETAPTSVPEPAVFAIFAGGLATALKRRRRGARTN